VIEQAMSRDPDRRFATAAEFSKAASAAFAGAIPEPSAIGEMIASRFELELGERRRRIERNVEEITSRPLEPVTSPAAIASTRPFEEPAAAPVVSPKRTTKWIWIAAATLAAVAALVGVVLSQRSAPSADTPPPTTSATPPVAVTAPVDAATPPVAAPTDAAPPSVALTSPDRVQGTSGPEKDRRATKHQDRAVHPAPSGPPGYLTIASRPYATIFVDDERLGVTPLYRIEVPSGKRRIRADCSCGKTQRFVIDVEPGVAAKPRNLTW
jgi:hypothetical protein